MSLFSWIRICIGLTFVCGVVYSLWVMSTQLSKISNIIVHEHTRSRNNEAYTKKIAYQLNQLIDATMDDEDDDVEPQKVVRPEEPSSFQNRLRTDLDTIDEEVPDMIDTKEVDHQMCYSEPAKNKNDCYSPALSDSSSWSESSVSQGQEQEQGQEQGQIEETPEEHRSSQSMTNDGLPLAGFYQIPMTQTSQAHSPDFFNMLQLIGNSMYANRRDGPVYESLEPAEIIVDDLTLGRVATGEYDRSPNDLIGESVVFGETIELIGIDGIDEYVVSGTDQDEVVQVVQDETIQDGVVDVDVSGTVQDETVQDETVQDETVQDGVVDVSGTVQDETVQDDVNSESSEEEADLSKLTKKELQALVANKGLHTAPSRLNRTDLVAILTENRNSV
jgi:hypothetical protein